MMKGMFKRALAGVAATALAVTGLALGAGAANAAGTVVHEPEVTFTFTGDAERVAHANLTAYKIGDFVDYGNNTYALETNENNADEVLRALNAVLDSGVPADTDPLAWAQSQTSAILGRDDTTWGYVNGEADSNVRKFADALIADNMDSVAEAVFDKTTDPTKITVNLEPGVYVFFDSSTDGAVTQAVPMIVSTGVSNGTTLTSVTNSPEVALKNIATVDQSKTASETSVSIGDTITYTLKGEIASPAPDSYKFVDTPGKGLTVKAGTFRVYAGDNGDTTDKEITEVEGAVTLPMADVTGNSSVTFEVVINKPADYAGKKITVTYDAVVNDQADVDAATGLVNTLDNYGDPVDTTVKFYKFGLHKTDKDSKNLANVSFEVKEANESGEATGDALNFVKQDDGSYKKVYDVDAVKGESTTVTTDSNGDITLKGLGEGYYQVTETANANPGYILDENDVVFTVHINEEGGVTVSTADTWGFATNANNDTVVEVLNIKSVTQLPLTGAAGTMLFTVLGLLIAGAGALVYMKSRNVKHALRG